MSNHTPGPWKCGNNDAFVYALNSNGTNIFFAGIGPGWSDDDKQASEEELLANARLIAAAPDLLEALEGLYLHTKNNHVIHGLNVKAAEALKKARGES